MRPLFLSRRARLSSALWHYVGSLGPFGAGVLVGFIIRWWLP